MQAKRTSFITYCKQTALKCKLNYIIITKYIYKVNQSLTISYYALLRYYCFRLALLSFGFSSNLTLGKLHKNFAASSLIATISVIATMDATSVCAEKNLIT